jgi:hypothetical protein
MNTEKKTALHEETSEAVERINTNLKECTICTIIVGEWGTRNMGRK